MDAALFLPRFEIQPNYHLSDKVAPSAGYCLIAVTKNVLSCKTEVEFTNCVIFRLLTEPTSIFACIYSATANSPHRVKTVEVKKSCGKLKKLKVEKAKTKLAPALQSDQKELEI